MKGVVRPQAIPTRRKPRVQRKMEGGGGSDEGSVVEPMAGGVRAGEGRALLGGKAA